MVKLRTKEVTVNLSKGNFSLFKKPKSSKKDYDFSGVSAIRQILNKEKARILDVLKSQNPSSIYELSKILKRGFKSVNDDVKLLERFGLLELVEEKVKNRKRYRPKVVIDRLIITLDF